MAHINRRYIDKHWTVFLMRGSLAVLFGFAAMFGMMPDLEMIVAVVGVFLLLMGIVDSVGALYASVKKHGWINSVIDALIDIAAAVALLVFARNDVVTTLIILAAYTVGSGVIDIFHGFLSTVDPTDRFIRVLTGVLGCVMGAVILNAGEFEMSTFIRFFGAYMLIVGVTSLIYGVHNRAQNTEDSIARRQTAKKVARMAAGGAVAAKAVKTAKKAKASKSAKRTGKKN